MLPRRQRSRAHSRPIAGAFAMAGERSIREQIAGTSANRSSPSRRRRNSRTRLRAAAAWLIVRAGCGAPREFSREPTMTARRAVPGTVRCRLSEHLRDTLCCPNPPPRACMLWRLQRHPGPAQCPIYRGCQRAGPSLTGRPAAFSVPACCRQNKKRDTPLVMTRGCKGGRKQPRGPPPPARDRNRVDPESRFFALAGRAARLSSPRRPRKQSR